MCCCNCFCGMARSKYAVLFVASHLTWKFSAFPYLSDPTIMCSLIKKWWCISEHVMASYFHWYQEPTSLLMAPSLIFCCHGLFIPADGVPQLLCHKTQRNKYPAIYHNRRCISRRVFPAIYHDCDWLGFFITCILIGSQ